jgi:hypothetical protein
VQSLFQQNFNFFLISESEIWRGLVSQMTNTELKVQMKFSSNTKIWIQQQHKFKTVLSPEGRHIATSDWLWNVAFFENSSDELGTGNTRHFRKSIVNNLLIFVTVHSDYLWIYTRKSRRQKNQLPYNDSYDSWDPPKIFLRFISLVFGEDGLKVWHWPWRTQRWQQVTWSNKQDELNK